MKAEREARKAANPNRDILPLIYYTNTHTIRGRYRRGLQDPAVPTIYLNSTRILDSHICGESSETDFQRLPVFNVNGRLHERRLHSECLSEPETVKDTAVNRAFNAIHETYP